ncbi:MAG: hypothetical protein MIO93_05655 [ANME-2 cluster archaeon]|nr:hypothetical protein [ANME-2 cluster archaeon]
MAALHRHNIQLIMNTRHPTADNEARILTPMHPRATTKAPTSPHTTRAGGVRSGRAPGQSEGENGRRESG